MKNIRLLQPIWGMLSGTLLLCAVAQASEPEVIEVDGRQFQLIGDMLVLDEPSISKVDSNISQWTNGNVYYEFANDVTTLNRQRFVEATQVWAEIADLEFIERTNEPNYIYVQNDNRNFATVGMVGGKQILSMTSWSSKFIIVHELGHSLGFWHEHMRSDRDNYVSIATENIQSGQSFNFTKRITTDYAPYDFLSVMHYSLTAFSANFQPTIVPQPEYQSIAQFAGQRSYISGGDQKAIAAYYGPKVITINDPAFKSYLVANFDQNSDGEIDSAEAAEVTSITTPGNGNITSLEGIEHFRYLTSLVAANENLSQLSALPSRIQQLDLRNNQFETVLFDWITPPLIEHINAAGNPMDAYACTDIADAELRLGANEVIVNPLADGTSLNCDEEDRFVLLNDKPRFDLRNKGTATYFIDVPAGQDSLTINSTHHDDQIGGLMDMYVAFNRTPTASDFDYSSTQPQNIESVTVNSPYAGRWYVSLVPSDGSFELIDLVASYSDQIIGQDELLKDTPISPIDGQQSEVVSYYMDVPENATDLSFAISGGTGDADLYVRFGAEPTLSSYDCRPWKTGNNEQCAMTNVQAGRYYINLVGYSAFSGVSLIGNYQLDDAPVGGSLNETNLTGSAGNWQYFTVDIPAGTELLNITTSGGTGDVDLYVKQGAQPSTSNYDCRPYRNGNNESCEFASPTATTWYIGLRGYTSYSGVTLEAIWQ